MKHNTRIRYISFILLIVIATLSQPLVLASETFELNGLSISKDRYGQWWIDVSPEDDFAKVKNIKTVLDDFLMQNERTAFFVKASHSHFEQQLQELGFELFVASNGQKEWIYKNGSPIPDAYTSTSGARGIIVHDGKVLLIEDAGRAGSLEIPGGGIEIDEFAEQAVIREIKEEVGLDVEIVQLIANWQYITNKRYGIVTDHGYFYLMKIKAGTTTEPTIDPKEVLQAIWVPLDQLSDVTLSPYTQVMMDHLTSSSAKTITTRKSDSPKATVYLFPVEGSLH